MTTQQPESPSFSRGPEDRLDSWKEIARYLGRKVRTVQRWEKLEGLPVRRHRHHGGGSVFALRQEIDAWREGRITGHAPDAAVPAASRERGPRDVGHGGTRWPRRWICAIAGLLAAVTVTAGLIVAWPSSRPPAGPGAPWRVVVLPFLDLTDDTVDGALRDGFHEEILTQLSGFEPGSLEVIGRISAMRCRDRGWSVAEIGAALDVDLVLEGSVRTEEACTRVSMRLLRTDGEDQLWARSLDLSRVGTLAAQMRTARVVVEAFAEHLGTSRAASPTRTNALAHDADRRGRYLWNKGTEDGFSRSIACFEEALRQDPMFVGAHIGLARAHIMLGRYGMRTPAETFPIGLKHLERALQLEPSNPEALAARAMVSHYWEWDFARAEQQFLQALERNPGLAFARHGYAHFLSVMGRHDEAISEADMARQLDPLCPVVVTDTAWFFYRARRYEEAIRECRHALELEPGRFGPTFCLVDCLQRLSRSGEAWTVLRDFLEARGSLDEIPGIEARDARTCLNAYHRWRLASLEDLQDERYVPPYSLAFANAILGEHDRAFECLREAMETRDRSVLLLAVHPLFDGLRDDPRHARLLDEVGLPRRPRGVLNCENSTPSAGEQRRQLQLAKFAHRSFGLDRDLALVDGAVATGVDEVAVDPDRDAVSEALDHHLVPLAERVFGVVGEVLDAAGVAFFDAPSLGRSTASFHVGDGDVFTDAPEVAGVAVVELHLQRAGEHVVEHARLGGVDENPAVPGLAGPAILDNQPVVVEGLVGDQVATWGTEAHQHVVAGFERGFDIRVCVGGGYIGMPTAEVDAVEEGTGDRKFRFEDGSVSTGVGAVGGLVVL